MASLFLSWSSADKVPALRLRDRLASLGIKVWEYSEDSAAGAQIHAEILKVVNEVQVAVICFSDATAGANWITTEVAWCWQRRLDPQSPLKTIVPVWVGPHPANVMPQLLRDNSIAPTDLEAANDDRLARFDEKILAAFGREAPEVVPAALFAMTAAEYQALMANVPQNWAVQDLCAKAGMELPPALFASLLKRYGPRLEDFDPFGAAMPLIDTIQAEVAAANRWRLRNGRNRRPVVLRWIQNDVYDTAARKLWTGRDSLLIIDSISMFDQGIAQRVKDLPDLIRTSLLWIPPYTQQGAMMEQSLKAVAGKIPRFGDLYETWSSEPFRHITFDSQTAVALRLWLHRALAEIASFQNADPEALETMNGIRDARVDLGSLYGGPARG